MVSLAVGLNFTVVVTSDGRVWQMGETGAPGKGAAWEGALTPTLVPPPNTSLPLRFPHPPSLTHPKRISVARSLQQSSRGLDNFCKFHRAFLHDFPSSTLR